MSPTRELAQQIAEEASALTSFWGKKGKNTIDPFNCCVFYGGTNMKADVRVVNEKDARGNLLIFLNP
jgi:superfamily II DNA/RNA helicase